MRRYAMNYEHGFQVSREDMSGVYDEGRGLTSPNIGFMWAVELKSCGFQSLVTLVDGAV
jgi:hypothetical protein